MIRRVVEYIITCDMGDRCAYDGFGNSTAFGSPTMKDCEESAKKYGWRQLSARLWLCPDCAKKAERANAHPPTNTGEGSSQVDS